MKPQGSEEHQGNHQCKLYPLFYDFIWLVVSLHYFDEYPYKKIEKKCIGLCPQFLAQELPRAPETLLTS